MRQELSLHGTSPYKSDNNTQPGRRTWSRSVHRHTVCHTSPAYAMHRLSIKNNVSHSVQTSRNTVDSAVYSTGLAESTDAYIRRHSEPFMTSLLKYCFTPVTSLPPYVKDKLLEVERVQCRISAVASELRIPAAHL